MGLVIVATVLRKPTGKSRWWLGLHIFQRTPGSATRLVRPASLAEAGGVAEAGCRGWRSLGQPEA